MSESLLHLLHERASHRGLVIASDSSLQGELGCSFQDLDAALAELVNAGRVEILSPLPWLVAMLRTPRLGLAHEARSWPGSSRSDVRSEHQVDNKMPAVNGEVAVSSAAAATQRREDGGAGEGDALLEEVLHILGTDADRDEFRTILAGHHPGLIRRCLRRVQAIRSIRVSRAALFRSLLTKLNN